MPTIMERRATLVDAAEKALAAMQDEMTEDAVKAANDAADELEKFDQRVADAEAATARFEKMARDSNQKVEKQAELKTNEDAVTLGERYVKSNNYRAWKRKNPGGVGEGGYVHLDRVRIGSLDDFMEGRKAQGAVIGTPVAHVPAQRYPTVDMTVRRPLTLLDLVSRGTARGDFEYVQVTKVTNNADIVAEATSESDGLKPTSDFQTQLADAKAHTYADGFVVTNNLLSDDKAMASFMNTQLGYNLDEVIEDKLLNGTGGSGQPRGILHTTGVQELQAAGAEAMQLIEAVRKAKTKLHKVRARPQAVLVNPEDNEKIDLLRDGNERFYGNGPFGAGPNTLWAMPIVESELVDVGTMLLGDFLQVALLDRDGLSVTAFNQHKDFAQRNLVYVRAELRAIQAIWRPDHLVHVVQGV